MEEYPKEITTIGEQICVFHTEKHNYGKVYLGGGVNHLFVKVYPKEIKTIWEQIFSLYSPKWSHFCSFTFHDVADHLLFFQCKSTLIKYPEKNLSLCAKMSASYPQFPSLSYGHRKFYGGQSSSMYVTLRSTILERSTWGIHHSWHLSIIQI